MLIEVAENQTKARGRFESVTMVTTVGSNEESSEEDRKFLGLWSVAWCSREQTGQEMCSGLGQINEGFY